MEKNKTSRIVNPKNNPFLCPLPDGVLPNDIDASQGEAWIDDDIIHKRIKIIGRDEILGACRSIKIDMLKTAPIRIRVGDDVDVICTSQVNGGASELEWLSKSKSSSTHMVDIEEVAKIIKCCKDDYIEDMAMSVDAGGLVSVEPATYSYRYNCMVPSVRKWVNTRISVRMKGNESIYRTWEKSLLDARPRPVKSARVFDCFVNKPILTSGETGAIKMVEPVSIVGKIAKRKKMITLLTSAVVTGEISNATPPMVIEPVKDSGKTITDMPVTLNFADDVRQVKGSQYKEMLKNQANLEMVKEHNNNQEVTVTPLIRQIEMDVGDNEKETITITTSQYILPEKMTSGKPIPISHTRTDLLANDEMYQTIVCLNTGVPRQLLVGETGMKTNTGMLQKRVADAVRAYAAQNSEILTWAINALMLGTKTQRLSKEVKNGAIKNQEEIDKQAENDFIHISFILPSYDEEILKQLYGFKAIGFKNTCKRWRDMYGITGDEETENISDPWDDEFKQSLLGKTSAKKPAVTGKDGKPAKTTSEKKASKGNEDKKVE